jgi:hypothetical protein
MNMKSILMAVAMGIALAIGGEIIWRIARWYLVLRMKRNMEKVREMLKKEISRLPPL